MSNNFALAQTQVPASLLPAVGTALALMAGVAVAGGVAGAALTMKKRPVWHYTGIGAGVAVGGMIGYLGGHFIVARTIAKLQAAEADAAEKAKGTPA